MNVTSEKASARNARTFRKNRTNRNNRKSRTNGTSRISGKRILLLVIPLILLLLLSACVLYVRDYYPAGARAAAILQDPGDVRIQPLQKGLFLDGPGKECALIFYPGAKVEYTAYLPLLHALASDGVDCFLIRMPANLAIFGINSAEEIMEAYTYEHWVLAGHSLGGAMAASYAAAHDLDGLVLLAAYPVKTVDERTLILYGSEDRVLNMEKLTASLQYLPENALVKEIEGGNHAQFGDYGIQKGDGTSSISPDAQQEIALQTIKALIADK